MTQEEIIEYNKRCALFLGAALKHSQGTAKVTHYILNGESYLDHMLQFHSNWNWIMEVVEAIEKLGHIVDMWNSICVIPHINNMSICETKKEAAVQAINQFLIWYNKETE